MNKIVRRIGSFVFGESDDIIKALNSPYLTIWKTILVFIKMYSWICYIKSIISKQTRSSINHLQLAGCVPSKR